MSISAFISTPDIQIEGKINQEHSSCFLPSMSSNLRGILKVREPCNEINLNQNSYSSVSYARWTYIIAETDSIKPDIVDKLKPWLFVKHPTERGATAT